MRLILQSALIILSCLIILTQSFYALPIELYQPKGIPRNTTNQTIPNNIVGLINPTVIQATTSENCTKDNCGVIFRTRFVTYQFTTGIYTNALLSITTKPPSPNPTETVYANSIMIGSKLKFSLKEQKEFAEENFKLIYANKSSSSIKSRMALDKKFTCAMDIPMAAERFEFKGKAYLIGVYDTYFCLTELPSNSSDTFLSQLNSIIDKSKFIKTKSIRLPPSNQNKKVDENFFKISAVAILPEDSGKVHALMFDEGGRLSSIKFNFENITRDASDANFQVLPEKSWTLSDLPLNDIYGNKNEVAPEMSPWRWRDAAGIMEKDLTETDKRKLNEHYDLAFIESITYFDEAVCFSRGLKIVTKPPIRCLSGKASNRLPKELTMTEKADGNPHKTILALEVFELGGSSINYHVVYQSVSDSVATKDPYEFQGQPQYWFCSVGKSSDGSYAGPPLGSNSTNSNCTNIELHRIPIDIVHIKSDQCNYLVSFYRYMYQINKINEGIHDEGKAVFAPWMPIDANAVMSHRDKLYFFLSGNTLNVYDYNPNKCDSLEVQPNYREYFSSELLRIFAKTYVINKGAKTSRNDVTSDIHFKGHLFEDGPPIYTGYRQKSGNEWFPQIGFQKPIDESHIIGTKSNPSSSMWTIVVLILVVLTLLIGILYYVFFYGKQESYNVMELKRLASKSKKTASGAGAGVNSSGGKRSPKSSTRQADAVVHSSKHSGANSQSQKVSDSKKNSKSSMSNKSIRHGKGGKSKLDRSKSAKTPRSPAVRPPKTK